MRSEDRDRVAGLAAERAPPGLERLVVLDPCDGWVQVVSPDKLTFDLILARDLSRLLKTEAVGYEVQGCSFAWRLACLDRGLLGERATSPAGLHDPDTLGPRGGRLDLRFVDVEPLAHAWLLDLSIPAARLFLEEKDLEAPEDQPGGPVEGTRLVRAAPDARLTTEPFRGWLPHSDGNVPLRPDVYFRERRRRSGGSTGSVRDRFTLGLTLGEEAQRSLLEAFDRRARRYTCATGASVHYDVAQADVHTALARTLASSTARRTFGLAGPGQAPD